MLYEKPFSRHPAGSAQVESDGANTSNNRLLGEEPGSRRHPAGLLRGGARLAGIASEGESDYLKVA